MLTGLYDARMHHVPVSAIVGQAETTSRGASYQQELNLDRLFADVAAFVQEAAVPAQVRHVLDRGIRVALARNAVAAVILPKDVQDAPWEAPAVAHGFTRFGAGYPSPRGVPQVAELAHAAEMLDAGKKIAILVGAGARGAAQEIIDVADILGAGVAKALLGKDVLPAGGVGNYDRS